MIIVLTPVRNEEWILEKFLTATSLFADSIIIADQQSSDNSRSICARFPKVELIENPKNDYDEANRQILLIETARNLFPDEDRILFSLDADEVITADSINARGWEVIKKAPKGTVFKFEKPTVFFDTSKTIRYFEGWPLAYKDDGVAHEASLIHSTRIPTPTYAQQVLIEDIKFLHLCFVRPNNQFSKNRFYCAIENVQKVSSLRMRRTMYNKYTFEDYARDGELQPTQTSWFDHYDKISLDLRNFPQMKYYWTDFEVLKMFHKYGTSRFFNESIWNFDWEACRQEAIARNIDSIPKEPLEFPSLFRTRMLDLFFRVLNKISNVKRKILSLITN